jgi:DNA invertase Pin-like site-specific DNA recombinase
VIRLAKTTAVLGVDQDLSGNEPDERGNFVAVAALQSATGVESVALNLNLNSTERVLAMSLPFIPYTRVSRVGKRRNDLLASHDDQIAAIRALAAREGLTLIDDLSFRDEDRSANDFNRANFARALELVLAGKAGGIVVATLDRFSRDVFAGAEMLKRIGERGALYADDAGGLIDLDDDESLIFYIMRGTMATLEHRRKARGLAAAVARSIRGGRHLADLYGYTRPEGFQTVTVDGESFKVRCRSSRIPTRRRRSCAPTKCARARASARHGRRSPTS